MPRPLDLFQPKPVPQREVWAVGGGKGGTGKSFMTANLGVTLSQMGKRVLLVDADLGCANLHTFLGANPRMTLSDFLQGKVSHLEQVLTPTSHANLSLLSGARDCMDILNAQHMDNGRLVHSIQELQFEYILLDLGAGTSDITLDFFLSANIGILVVIPEPTSVENAYRFIKGAFYRRLQQWINGPRMKQVIREAVGRKDEQGIQTPRDMVNYMASLENGEGEALKNKIFSFSPRVVVNQVRNADDITLGFSMRSACAKYFGIQVNYVGYVHYDDHIWKAIRKKVPFIAENPHTDSARCIHQIVSNLIKKQDLPLEAVFRMARI